jgi:hypothetical protein
MIYICGIPILLFFIWFVWEVAHAKQDPSTMDADASHE